MNGQERIKENADFILLSEIYSLLHDLGKLSKEFIVEQSKECFDSKKNYSIYCKFKHYNIFSENNDKFDYSEFLSSSFKEIISKEVFKDIINKNIRTNTIKPIFSEKLAGPKEIISEHHGKKTDKRLIELLKNIDRLDSGVDKGILQNIGKQSIECTKISTSFGHEKKINIEDLKPSRENLCNELSTYLEEISEKPDNIVMQRKKIIELLKKEFLKALGDTRRSGNDVTLWDHSYSVASLYKSAIANMIHNGEWTNLKDLKWVIIGVQYDKLGLVEKAHKLVDIVAYRKLTEDIDQEIKTYIEEEFPIGNEIYRDESGIYFVGPDIGRDSLEKLIKEEILCRVNKKSDGEVIPYISISESSRSLVLLTNLLTEARGNFQLHEEVPEWKEKWDQVLTIDVQDAQVSKSSCDVCKSNDQCINNGRIKRSFCKNTCTRYHECIAGGGNKEYQVDICPVCKVHPKCEHQEVCKCCLNRGESRIKDWLPNNFSDKKYPTIWINEIADSNGKVAIVTGRFNLSKWLNGELLNTVFSQTTQNLESYDNWNSLSDCLRQELKINKGKPKCLEEIAGESYQREMNSHQFYENLVVDRNPLWDAKINNWKDGSSCEKATERLLLTIFRKHPSPSRLRRIWTSTETFWKETSDFLKNNENYYIYIPTAHDYKDIETSSKIRFKRLNITLKDTKGLLRGTYVAKFKKLSIVMYFDGEKFITTQNLDIPELKGLFDDTTDKLKKYIGDEIEIELEGTKPDKFERYIINDVFYGSYYNPFLEVLLSPVTFQFIVPANSVPKIISEIHAKYSLEMGNVAGRLPLNLGVVFFDSKTALYAAVNASRRMLNGFEDVEFMDFSVSNFSKDSPIVNLEVDNLEVDNQGIRKKEIQLNKCLDEQAKYYFNFLLKTSEDKAQKKKSFFKTFIENEKEFLINGSDLDQGDCVKLYPNYFDFEFLDTTARRLEISYDSDHKRIDKSSLKGSKPYLLEEFSSVFEKVWNLFNTQYMTTSQLKNIQENLVKLHMDWKDCKEKNKTEYYETLEKQIENILINVGTRKWWNSLDKEGKELLKKVCLDKTIFDILEFYNSILKLKPNGDKNE
ncbi:CRISPR-associated protein Csx11 [Methanosarcina siciliae T4/M]|uniref:CRISPR-associated protein Csx11 n=2 Tax=Methanosarcina siciliae TaxID=38027 RepID=A0A0E3P4D1_9EURY|nr:CRISPR-associated protein Csx11 [Methanosarcina siciliae T4/M]